MVFSIYSLFIFITMYCKTYYSSCIANCSVDRAQVDGGRSPNHFGPMDWVSPESSCHCDNNSHIILRLKRRNIGEREKRLSTSYLELLIILDFGFFSEWFLCPGGLYAPSSTVGGT
jgi:hypothetical protein